MKKLFSFVCVFGLLGLAACGFRPIYGSLDGGGNSPVAMDLNNVTIENIPDRDGQFLRNRLIDRMYGKNRPEKPVYRLVIKLRHSEQDLGILANATATRELLDMYGDYVLRDGQGRELVKGTAHSVASFDKLDQMYGTVAARQNAHERTLSEVGDQIVNRLSLYFAERS